MKHSSIEKNQNIFFKLNIMKLLQGIRNKLNKNPACLEYVFIENALFNIIRMGAIKARTFKVPNAFHINIY